MRNKLEVNIITPTTTFEYTNVDYLRASSTEGLFGVLPGHISSIIALDIGEVKITIKNKSLHFSMSGGFADINNDKVVLVLETAEESSKIDSKRAKQSLDRSKKYLDDKSNDLNRAFNSIKRAKNRIMIADKKR
jgi:F-type H+-transporting ATPase subunit epsilon